MFFFVKFKQLFLFQHFLCKNLTEAPEISITFTRHDSVQLQARWMKFHSVMSKLSEKYSQKWIDVVMKQLK